MKKMKTFPYFHIIKILCNIDYEDASTKNIEYFEKVDDNFDKRNKIIIEEFVEQDEENQT